MTKPEEGKVVGNGNVWFNDDSDDEGVDGGEEVAVHCNDDGRFRNTRHSTRHPI